MDGRLIVAEVNEHSSVDYMIFRPPRQQSAVDFVHPNADLVAMSSSIKVHTTSHSRQGRINDASITSACDSTNVSYGLKSGNLALICPDSSSVSDTTSQS